MLSNLRNLVEISCAYLYTLVSLHFEQYRYMFDFETADKLVDPQIHEAFFVTAVSNSCVNPIIYGNYMKKYWKNLRNAACRSRNSSTSSSRIASSRTTNNQHHQRTGSTYRCTNPNHHFTLSPRCHSSANASDVTM